MIGAINAFSKSGECWNVFSKRSSPPKRLILRRNRRFGEKRLILQRNQRFSPKCSIQRPTPWCATRSTILTIDSGTESSGAHSQNPDVPPNSACANPHANLSVLLYCVLPVEPNKHKIYRAGALRSFLRPLHARLWRSIAP